MRSSLLFNTVLASAAIAAIVLGVLLGQSQPATGQPPKGGGPPPAPKVIVTAARADTIAEPRAFVGTVRPIRKSLVGSAAAGRVEDYLINEGDFVKAGQPIAHLRRGIIQAELDAAKAELLVRQAELGELERSHRDEIEQAQARLALAEAALKFRQAKMERSKALGSSVSRELHEEDFSMAAQAAASVREHGAAVRMMTEGARHMRTEQARAKVEGQRAEVQRLQEQFDRHTMYAPFDGFVSAEHTEVGQWVMQGDPVAEIVELNEVDVEIAVVEDYVGNLNTAVEGTVDVPALPNEKFTGRVAIINPQADARSHTFPVKVRVANRIDTDQPLLKSGMFARVTMSVGKPTPCVLVPKDAVVLGGQTPMIFVAAVAEGKTTVRPVPVTLGPAQGTWIAAIGPIKAGEPVIVEGNERVRPGQEVRTETKEVAYP
jgi:RND family efflux transporter MFP subunit